MKKNIFAFFSLSFLVLFLLGCDFVNTTTNNTTLSNQITTTELDTSISTNEVTTSNIYVEPFVSITDLTITSTSIAFSIIIEYSDINLTIESVSLILNDETISTATGDNVSFLGLLSDTSYTLLITYQYILIEETIIGTKTIDVSTISMNSPNISVSASAVTTDSFQLSLSVNDQDSISTILSIELYDGDTLLETINELSTTFSFNDLLSDHEYLVKVYYQYDLNDGTGIVSSSFDLTIQTLANSIPSVNVNSNNISYDSFEVNASMNDQDSVGTMLSLELYDGDTLLETINDFSLSTFSFDEMLSDHEYHIILNYQYDLNDGIGIISNSFDLTIETLAKSRPSINLNSSNITYDSFQINASLNDTSSVGQLIELRLYNGETLIETITDFTSLVQFTNLYSNNNYQVEVDYQYDLNDGQGIHYKTSFIIVTTLAKTVPTPILEAQDIDQYSFKISAGINDASSVGQLTSLEIWQDSTLLYTQTDFSSALEMTELLSEYDYTIVLNYSYDLEDGNGLHNETYTITVSTLAIPQPIPEITVLSTSTTELTIGVTFNDDYKVGSLNTFMFCDGDTLVKTDTDFTSSFVYSNLLSNHEYTFVLEYEYDLNDGLGLQTATVSNTFSTSPMIKPDIVLTVTSVTSSTIDFIIDVKNYDLVGEILSIELWQDQTLIESLSDLSIRSFTGLANPLNNTLILTFSYDLNDGLGVIQETISTELSTLTAQQFEINYHLDGGINNNDNPLTYCYDDGNFLLLNPSKEGYSFIGWYDNPEFNGNVISYISQGTLGNFDLYAKWQVETFDVDYCIYDDYYYETEIFFTLYGINAQGYNASLTLYDDGTYYLQYEVYYGVLKESGIWYWRNYEFTIIQEDDTILTGILNASSNTISIDYSIINSPSSNVTFNISYSLWQDAWGDSGNYAPVINNIDDSLPLEGEESIVTLSTDGDNISVITSDNRIISWGENSVSGIWGTDISDNLYMPTDITSLFDLNPDETIIKTVVGNQIYVITSEYRILYTYLAKDSLTGNYYMDTKEFSDISLNIGEIIVDIAYGEHLTRTYLAVLTNQGRMFMIGNNDYGQLGIGTTTGASTWTDITNNFGLQSSEAIIGMSIGGGRSSAWTSSGRFFIWGDDGYDDLMELASNGSKLPIDATSALGLNTGETILQVSVTNFHFLILTSDNRLLACGYGGGKMPHDISILMDLNVSESIETISSALNYSGVLTNEGRLVVWEGVPSSTTTTTAWYNEANLYFNLDVDEEIQNISFGANQYAKAYIAFTNKDRIFMWGNSDGVLGTYGTVGVTTPIEGDIVLPTIVYTEEVEFGSDIIGYLPTIDNDDAYIFYGWYSDPECEIEYTFGAMGGENLKLYGYFLPKAFWIMYNLDGGTNADNPYAFTIESDTITLIDPTKDGYTFDGWYDNDSFSGSAITEITSGTYQNIVLYAKWTVNQYTMTFDTSGGSLIETYTVEAGADIIAPSDPSRQGYSFVGWYADEYYIDTYSFSTMPSGDITVYAKWEANVYIVTYIFNNEDANQTIADYADSPFNPLTPTYTGYIFEGWYLDEALTIPFTLDSFPTENTSLYAKWSLQ